MAAPVLAPAVLLLCAPSPTTHWVACWLAASRRRSMADYTYYTWSLRANAAVTACYVLAGLYYLIFSS